MYCIWASPNKWPEPTLVGSRPAQNKLGRGRPNKEAGRGWPKIVGSISA